jgi:hypothetical protein
MITEPMEGTPYFFRVSEGKSSRVITVDDYLAIQRGILEPVLTDFGYIDFRVVDGRRYNLFLDSLKRDKKRAYAQELEAQRQASVTE